MVVFIVGGVAGRHGLILKGTETIEIGRKISHVIFDKTGTLTQGKLSIVHEEYSDDSDSVASTIMGMISNSKHPVSAAVAAHLARKGIKAAQVENITSSPGKGMEAT
jgi:cation transport ATPase